VIIDTGCSIMLLEIHSMQTHSSMHTLRMYISYCNENMEIEYADGWYLGNNESS